MKTSTKIIPATIIFFVLIFCNSVVLVGLKKLSTYNFIFNLKSPIYFFKQTIYLSVVREHSVLMSMY